MIAKRSVPRVGRGQGRLVKASSVANPIAVSCIGFSFDRFALMKNGRRDRAVFNRQRGSTARKYAVAALAL
jgi:hypothetical protein